MNLRQSIHKATLLVDLKSDVDSAIQVLSQSIKENKFEVFNINSFQAKMLLAELFFEVGKYKQADLLLREIAGTSIIESY